MARSKETSDKEKLGKVVEDIVGRMGIIEDFGKTADHIKGLSEIETDKFGIAVVTADGAMVTGGDCDDLFPIQSISKVFALTIALRALGEDVWKRVGREPSGDPFNSLVDLERLKGFPRNPFINAGALVIDDILLGIGKDHEGPSRVKELLESETGEKDLPVERSIIDEDGDTAGFLNRAMANLAKSFDNLHHPVDKVMRVYVEQCAVKLSCRQLALAGRYLMSGKSNGERRDPDTENLSRRVNSLMLTCGQYDGSGEFAYRVGLPAKSGVSGAILAVCPDVASIAVWSPALDTNGNSMLGTLALEQLTREMNWSVFG